MGYEDRGGYWVVRETKRRKRTGQKLNRRQGPNERSHETAGIVAQRQWLAELVWLTHGVRSTNYGEILRSWPGEGSLRTCLDGPWEKKKA